MPIKMTNGRLIEHRNATLDLYRKLSKIRLESGKPIPKTVEKSHSNLDQNRFLLAIVGKVKAGKSTFINALIGKNLLPTDALQATAAIIEIFRADKPFLRVTYANGKEEITPSDADDNLAPLTEKLREVAAIRGSTADLPIAQLHDFIIDRYNKETKQAEWDPKILDLFLKNNLPNIHNLSEAELIERSTQYLESHRDGNGVAMRIEVGYPHDYQFDHFRIVDTPGICAKGGFAERTLDFLINADGVIYLHKEEPSENTLHDALQNVIPEKAKKHMLLVLTHKSGRTQQANNAFLSEAPKCCSQISKDRIFIVDSLTEIVLQSIYGKDMNQITDLCGQVEEWNQCIAMPFMQAKGNSAEFFDLLEKQSNMRSMKEEILRMSEKSLGIQIETLIAAIQELYAELAEDAKIRRDAYGQKMKDPQMFAAAIGREMYLMQQLDAESGKRIRDIQKEFDLDLSTQRFAGKLIKITQEAKNQIDGKEFSSGDTAKTANDFLTKINQDIDDDLKKLVEEIKTTFGQTILDMEVALQDDFEITVPKIPLTELLEQLRKEATKPVTVKVKRKDIWSKFLQAISGGNWGSEEQIEQRFNAKDYFDQARTTVLAKLEEIKMKIAESVKEAIKDACKQYRASVSGKLHDRQEFLKKIEREQLENEAIQNRYNNESQLNDVEREIEKCARIRGDL